MGNGRPKRLNQLEDAAYDMASFCIVTKLSPTDYRQLTLRERQAFLDALNDMHRKEP